MTLKHKNQNKWAKRILARGLSSQDEGTRAAIAEQLQRHTELTRKMNSMKDSSSSSDDTSDGDDEDENSAGSDQERASKLLEKAKDKTIKVLEEEDEVPKSGLLSLPFMVILVNSCYFNRISQPLFVATLDKAVDKLLCLDDFIFKFRLISTGRSM